MSAVLRMVTNPPFQNVLSGNAIFLKECNALSNEMKKRVQYQFTLIQNTENSNCLSGSFSKLSQVSFKLNIFLSLSEF